MSTIKRFRLILTGASAGQSMVINHREFVNGIYTFNDTEANAIGLINYFATFNAYPEGSKELMDAQIRDRMVKNRISKNDEVADRAEPVRRENSGTSGDSKSETPFDAGDDFSEGGSDCGVSGGGASDSDGENPVSGGSDKPSFKDAKVISTVSGFDPDDVSKWTAGGKVSVSAVEEILGMGITRSDIDSAMPNYNRESARAKKAGLT